MANLVSEQELFFTAFEPKTANRYIMYLDGIPSYLIKKTDRPNLKQDAKQIDHINLRRFVKGKSVWGPMKIELFDPIVPSGAQAVMEWIRLHHESVTGRDGYAEFYKKDIVINVLGPVGDKVEEWILKGAQITEVNFGEASWDKDDLMGISVTIQPDFCILNY
jgi:hypothetical protein